MNKKHLLILGVIFIALFGVFLAQKAREKQIPAGEHRREVWKPLIPVDQAARISFSKPGHPPLSLSRDASGWKIDSLSGVAGDTQKVNEILNQVNQIQAEWRAEGEEYFERFGVAENQAFRLKILTADGSAMVDFYIGIKRSGKGVFIRLSDKSKIYFVAEDWPALFGLYADLEPAIPLPIFFADLRLVPETFEQIRRFELMEGAAGKKSTIAALERPSAEAGTPWAFVANFGSFSPGFEKVEDYLAKLTGAHGENIVTVPGVWKPEFEITVRDEKGKLLRLVFAKSGAAAEKLERWFVRREGSPQTFEVSSLVVDDLKIEDAELIEDNPLHIEIDPGYAVELQDEKRTEVFSHSSGWPSAAAVLDALSRLRFLTKETGITALDLQDLPPTHRVKIKRLNVDVAELSFYVSDPKLQEIKTLISGQEAVFVVSREFFETIFISESVPPADDSAVPEVLAAVI
ncbi:MAG TPA: hypothetical protein DIS66_08305 [Candidatus Omnitrophica bacterium]|nr:hypothetical protein [Candidatus Omnitrophota bacterium]